jgi:hypothetical protein
MSKSAALLLVLVFLIASCAIGIKPVSAASPNSWTSKAPMRQARTGLGVAVVNDKIYAIGGSTASGSLPGIGGGGGVLGYRDLGGHVGTNEVYAPTSDMWTTKEPMPTPRIVFTTAVCQNKIYCIGGKTSNGFTGVNEVYDPATDTWENRAPMPTARGWVTAGVVKGKIYLIGGSPNGTLNEVYDPAANSWTTKASMPFAAWGKAAIVDDKIYVISGSKLQIYDPATDRWSQGAPPPSGVGYGAGVTTGVLAPRRVYAIGDSVGVYDPENDTWAVGADIPTNRFNFGVAVVKDMLYAIGGHTSGDPWIGDFAAVNVNEQYTPFGYGTVPHVPPAVHVVSPENKTYASSSISLVFTVNKPASWLGYRLDGQEPVTVTGNTTITGLSAGLHNLTVYAKDEFENIGVSETIKFTIALVIHVLSPERRTYNTSSIPLNFTVNSALAQITYCLNGEKNITVSGNTTLSGLANGDYALTFYAKDEAGNVRASETILFTVDVPFPTTLVLASVITVAVVGIGLLVYFKKRKR